MPPNAIVYPIIPNSEPEVKAAMLREVGVSSVEELFHTIPDELRLKQPLNLPPPLLAEYSLVRHVESILHKNITAREYVSFLGAGCYQHHVPAVCDEINSRGEFLTAYAGEPYEDHGRFQALWEYASMMGELLNMDVVNVPTYDGFQAAATALRMACRITGREKVLVSAAIGRDKLSRIQDYLKPGIAIDLIPFDPASGQINLVSLTGALSSDIAAVYFENPAYLGVIELQGQTIVEAVHEVGALAVVGVDPISLGVLAPPADYGADIACGDIQPLGMHPQAGGGMGGFIATRDDEAFVMEYPSRLFGVAPTSAPGEYGFGDVAYERTSFAHREQGKEWVGTAAALWGVTAGVYLALMGPKGMVELGEGVMSRTAYAMRRVAAIPGVQLPFAGTPHFQEFVVDFSETGKSVAEINHRLLKRGIFGGKDLSREFPRLGQSMLVCVTEVHSQSDIDFLADALQEVLK